MALRFCGIGAMRCATTWTFACLQAHPEISFPGGKQIHFWDKRYGSDDHGTDTTWYESIFDQASPLAEGEITPAYAVLDEEQVAALARFAPELRVFYVVRHPVDRAWSSVRLHVRRNDLDPSDLTEDWLRERITGPGVIKRNRYEATVATWQRHFGSDGFLVLPYDLATSQPGEFLARIARHIGVSDAPFVQPDHAMQAEIGHVRNIGSEVALSDELRTLAEETYAADIAWYETHVAPESSSY